MTELPKAYNPKAVEDRIYKLWVRSQFFTPEKLRRGGIKGLIQKKFVVAIAPPNITGELHMGHALENILVDIIVRMKRMQSYQVLWVPGLDHAGIAAQNVVEKELAKEGLTRHTLGREKFLERMWAWKEKYGSTILEQFKKLGLSIDWSRTRFTLDEDYKKAVNEAFLHYWQKGWIYKGSRVINFCPRCQTAISDLEVEHEETKGKLYYIRYPLVKEPAEALAPGLRSRSSFGGVGKAGGSADYVVVATTRPETMLGDAAVAVHPDDERYKNLIGKKVSLPLQNREIPVIADGAVDMNFGTGAVKVTPAHSIDDFEISERHNKKIQNPTAIPPPASGGAEPSTSNDKIQIYEIIDKNGKMTEEAGPLCQGLTTSECRQRVVEELQKQGLLEKTEELVHGIGHCERCGTTIEPLYSKQWFLKMKELAGQAKEAVKSGAVKIQPEKWKIPYLKWLDNIKDWNISRQLWWGHKIPLEGEEDVLDTWFSSALWPFAVFYWPNKKHPDYKRYYPTRFISSGREILHLWITRMIFSGIELTKNEPFKNVYIHPTVLTKEGRRMSKSLGTGINPLELIERHGADALRFGLAFQTTGVQDMRFNEDVIEGGRKFANKIWNVARFTLMNLEPSVQALAKEDSFELKLPSKLDKIDKEFVQGFKGLTKSFTENIENYNFGQAANELYHFFWDRFASVYIEDAKTKIKESNLESKSYKLKAMLWLLANQLKLLHPIMPFLTEEIWAKLPIKNKKLVMVESWPPHHNE